MSGHNIPDEIPPDPALSAAGLAGRKPSVTGDQTSSQSNSPATDTQDGYTAIFRLAQDAVGLLGAESKVAIPRMSGHRSVPSNRRVGKACENCRDLKVKCSGHRPICVRCQDAGLLCVYDDNKREKMDKDLKSLTSQVQVYESLLREISRKIEPEIAEHIEQTLSGNSQRGTHNNQISSQVNSTALASQADPVPFLGGLDYTNEDYNRDVKIQAMGFIGEHSVMTWLYRLKRMLDESSTVTTAGVIDHDSVASVNFFVDDSAIPLMDDVELSQRPPLAIANRYVDRYLEVIHPSFPIIGKIIFLEQYRSFYSTQFVRPGKRWLAIINLVFAIAATHARHEQTGSPNTTDDGFAYFSRAWKLSMNDISLLDHPNLQQVQVEGLAAFYLMSVGQINRAWRICGIAMRTAVTMGLNLRSESNAIAPVSKETRYRVWWSLYMIETSLCVMTGRPPSVNDGFCTTPLPIPLAEEDFEHEDVAQLITNNETRQLLMRRLFLRGAQPLEATPPTIDPASAETGDVDKQYELYISEVVAAFQPNSSLYFLLMTDLVSIMRESIEKLYAPKAAQRPWGETEKMISSLDNKADAWRKRLPSEYDFVNGSPLFIRERVSLAFRFYKTKILITQPCLNRVTSRLLDNFDHKDTLCTALAVKCVDLAIQMMGLFPDVPDSSWVYNTSPWWCVLHYLMQPTAVLLIELFLGAGGQTPAYEKVITQLPKVIRWLVELSTKDPSAERAWQLCRDIISQYAPDLRVGDLPNAQDAGPMPPRESPF